MFIALLSSKRRRAIRGVRCPYCGHDTRMFSAVCGKCYQVKPLLQRMPIYLFWFVLVLVPVLVIVGVTIGFDRLLLKGG